MRVRAGPYAVCRLPPAAELPAWAHAGDVSVVSRTPEELSIFVAQDAVPTDVTHAPGYALLGVLGPLPLSWTGILARLARVLADADVPILAMCTYDTDYLAVPAAQLDDAIDALRADGIAVDG